MNFFYLLDVKPKKSFIANGKVRFSHRYLPKSFRDCNRCVDVYYDVKPRRLTFNPQRRLAWGTP
jgi:hypothetical protein